MTSEQHSPERREITIRRAPRFVPFMALGAVAAFIVALVMAYTGDENPQYTREAVLGFFTVMFMLPGVALGSIAALILDRLSIRRSERAVVEAADDEPGSTGTSPAA
ncbi:MAG: NrfD/PsrC family molybdoenzyme membrane anchor subunit [Arthrobacter sp.]